jgi:tRNA C32,U32 (ribose-2'-O)-methylase TrmJ
MDPEAFAAEATRRPGRVALVFGDERTGLGREDLAHCHSLTRIPADAGQPSLNLARAICVYAYALAREPGRAVRAAPRPGLERVLDELLRSVRFVRAGRPGVGPLVARWRRSGLTRTEIRLWESAFRTLARPLSHSKDPGHLSRHRHR